MDTAPVGDDDAVTSAMSVGTAPTIGLALSGGGVRAMAFHLGVLRYLAERGVLERVSRVSTVSGGSLLVGLMLQLSGYKWPSSADFELVYGKLRADMCRRGLMWAGLRQLLRPWNWIYLLSRANLVAKALQGWGVRASLSELPEIPEWSINGTTAENGRRFRFKRDSIGDWQFGYATAGKFPLAKAMAVSAAIPGGIGPLSIKTTEFEWWKRKSWNLNVPPEKVVLPFRRLRLYDGGVYDNLGLEPFFDVGTQRPKVQNLSIYVSDAGAPLTTGRIALGLSPWRLIRLADIMTEQSRALRVRAFYQFLQESPWPAGAYAYIGTTMPGEDEAEARLARSFRTSLRRLKPDQFDAIAKHGYAVAQGVEMQHRFLERFGAAAQ